MLHTADSNCQSLGP